MTAGAMKPSRTLKNGTLSLVTGQKISGRASFKLQASSEFWLNVAKNPPRGRGGFSAFFGLLRLTHGPAGSDALLVGPAVSLHSGAAPLV